MRSGSLRRRAAPLISVFFATNIVSHGAHHDNDDDWRVTAAAIFMICASNVIQDVAECHAACLYLRVVLCSIASLSSSFTGSTLMEALWSLTSVTVKRHFMMGLENVRKRFEKRNHIFAMKAEKLLRPCVVGWYENESASYRLKNQ